ncbi:uncharacterized protein FIBRA_06935 [Fibroporia radiculosa]|uniref:Fido domain-containing protein n=1 Tax=Fibroporia radiculosa TaxID=599839 RepID=J4GTX1_9APHY|nr:uncharacterized protein FIBRA_06935 [Fibroporia radiculosa]CCM04745.1 predicted protein [Fibroporia radiculosa]
MSIAALRLSRLFTPTYAKLINAQLVHPAQSQVVKPNELRSALARPLNVALYEPDKSPSFLAASLSYGIIKGGAAPFLSCVGSASHEDTGHPFLDGNKRTAFFLANEYLRAQGHPGLADGGKVSDVNKDLIACAERHIGVASGKLDVADLARDP